MGFKAMAGALALGTAMFATAAFAEGHTSEYAGSKGYVENYGAKGYVAEQRAVRYVRGDRLTYRHRSERRGPGPLYHVPGCPEGFNGIYRGNMYCIDGRPID